MGETIVMLTHQDSALGFHYLTVELPLLHYFQVGGGVVAYALQQGGELEVPERLSPPPVLLLRGGSIRIRKGVLASQFLHRPCLAKNPAHPFMRLRGSGLQPTLDTVQTRYLSSPTLEMRHGDLQEDECSITENM